MATEFRIVRVLVVEDFEPFVRLIRSILRDKPELQIIGEVSDGMEGVRRAEELRPDLVLLDVGLPGLNGIEVARRIRKLAPAARIIFVTQESSADVVEAALTAGAAGYVAKIRITHDLLLAVEAVRQERQFVSKGLSGHKCSEETDAPVSRSPCWPAPHSLRQTEGICLATTRLTSIPMMQPS